MSQLPLCGIHGTDSFPFTDEVDTTAFREPFFAHIALPLEKKQSWASRKLADFQSRAINVVEKSYRIKLHFDRNMFTWQDNYVYSSSPFLQSADSIHLTIKQIYGRTLVGRRSTKNLKFPSLKFLKHYKPVRQCRISHKTPPVGGPK